MICTVGSRNAATCAGVSGKCRKWTDEVLPSSRVRSTSSSLTAVGALAAELEEEVVLDPAQLAQHAGAADRIVDLEHQGGDQLRALRDQRVVGGQFVGQLLVAALLDQQHLLDLEQHGLEALEIDGALGAERDPAQALGRQQGGAARPCARRELGGGDDVGGGDLAVAAGMAVSIRRGRRRGQDFDRVGLGGRRGALLQCRRETSWPRCLQASGQSEQRVSLPFCATWRAAGLPTFTAMR